MTVVAFDHIAFPTANAERLIQFYRSLGFGIEGAEEWRAGNRWTFSIVFGDNKINVHPENLVEERGESWYALRAPAAEAGCADVCFVWVGGMQDLLDTLDRAGIGPIEGPVQRFGGRDAGSAVGVSVYTRDPDDNLLEFISYDPADLERSAPNWR